MFDKIFIIPKKYFSIYYFTQYMVFCQVFLHNLLWFYYTFYFLKNKSVYKINDLDRFWIPNPADFPGIEEQIISTLTKNHKAYKIKK